MRGFPGKSSRWIGRLILRRDARSAVDHRQCSMLNISVAWHYSERWVVGDACVNLPEPSSFVAMIRAAFVLSR